MGKGYYKNPYQKDFVAEIINVVKKDNKYYIELDETYFYPEGGGQPNDTGFIDDPPVTYVYRRSILLWRYFQMTRSLV